MSKKFWNTVWIVAWIVLYVSVVALGFSGKVTAFSRIVGVAFFLPPVVLLWRGIKEKNQRIVRWVRCIAIVSLMLTTLTLIAIMLSVTSQKDLDSLLQAVLLLVSAPLLCFKSWLVGLFGWACLVSGSFLSKKL